MDLLLFIFIVILAIAFLITIIVSIALYVNAEPPVSPIYIIEGNDYPLPSEFDTDSFDVPIIVRKITDSGELNTYLHSLKVGSNVIIMLSDQELNDEVVNVLSQFSNFLNIILTASTDDQTRETLKLSYFTAASKNNFLNAVTSNSNVYFPYVKLSENFGNDRELEGDEFFREKGYKIINNVNELSSNSQSNATLLDLSTFENYEEELTNVKKIILSYIEPSRYTENTATVQPSSAFAVSVGSSYNKIFGGDDTIPCPYPYASLPWLIKNIKEINNYSLKGNEKGGISYGYKESEISSKKWKITIIQSTGRVPFIPTEKQDQIASQSLRNIEFIDYPTEEYPTLIDAVNSAISGKPSMIIMQVESGELLEVGSILNEVSNSIQIVSTSSTVSAVRNTFKDFYYTLTTDEQFLSKAFAGFSSVNVGILINKGDSEYNSTIMAFAGSKGIIVFDITNEPLNDSQINDINSCDYLFVSTLYSIESQQDVVTEVNRTTYSKDIGFVNIGPIFIPSFDNIINIEVFYPQSNGSIGILSENNILLTENEKLLVHPSISSILYLLTLYTGLTSGGLLLKGEVDGEVNVATPSLNKYTITL